MWSKYRTSILLAVTCILLLSAFWIFPSLAFISFIAILLQLLLRSTVERLAKRLPLAVSAGIVVMGFVLLMIALLAIISDSFIPTFTEFITRLPDLSNNLQNIPFLQNYAFLSSEIDNLLKELTSASIDTLKSSLGMLLSLFNKFIDLIIIIFVTFYLLKDGEKIKNYLASLFPNQDHRRVSELFDRLLITLRGYIYSQLVICCITGIIVFLYFTLRHLPYASIFAVVSGISEFVPVLGPTVASAFGTILTATQDPWIAMQTLAFYLLLTQINHNIVYPTLIGKTLDLHPVAIILSVVLGGELLGTAGMFLAVPCVTICKIVIEDIYTDHKNKCPTKNN
jgi:predicted PurR-regulated permease PerM